MLRSLFATPCLAITLMLTACGGGSSSAPPPSSPSSTGGESSSKHSFSRTCEGLDNKTFNQCLSTALSELRFQDVIEACARKEMSLTRGEEESRLKVCSAYLVVSAEMTDRREGGNGVTRAMCGNDATRADRINFVAVVAKMSSIVLGIDQHYTKEARDEKLGSIIANLLNLCDVSDAEVAARVKEMQ